MPSRLRRACTIFPLLLVVLAPGCGDGRASLEGKVALDGTPVETGLVTLIPVEGNPGLGGRAQIIKGRYSFAGAGRPAAGTYRVEISAKRKTGRQVPAGSPAPAGTMVDEEVEGVPAEYNKNSSLRATLNPGSNVQDFTLASKGAG
jgi:hypothetical protein